VASATPVAESRIEVFGIRHHGPGSARSLVAALDAYEPDAVLIEGPADADPLLEWVLAEGMQPPLALLAYAADQPGDAAFWPFAVFSPEWQAMTWAARHDVEVRFCDLPAGMVLARGRRPAIRVRSPETEPPTVNPAAEEPEQSRAEPTDNQGRELDQDGPEEAEHPAVTPRRRRRRERQDPLAVLAATAGYDDAERWWDDVIESRGGVGGPSPSGSTQSPGNANLAADGTPTPFSVEASPFPALIEAMAELRATLSGDKDAEGPVEARREAYMRQTIRAAVRRGRGRIAVVCGAWHAPVLTSPLPPATRDAQLLRGAGRRKVTITWVPWTHERLASDSGYGAGIDSPGWYHHLWTAPDQPVSRWLTKVARSLRGRDLAVSSAHVIEAVRLAETLAALRGRPLAGLSEVMDATRSVLCDGDDIAVRHITRDLVVGQAIGAVNERVPTTPFEADLVATCRAVKVRRELAPRVFDLDLRRGIDQARSKLFHRLQLLDIDWIEPAASDVQSLGTFRETWRAAWQPELSVAVMTASVWGTTVAGAAAARVREISARGGLAELTRTVERCLYADLPDALDELLQVLADKAALDADVVHLMDALPALARAQRYGDVRQTDTGALRQVSTVIVRRICAGLPRAVAGLDADGATAMRRRIDGIQGSVGLLAESAEDLRATWLRTLAGLIDRTDMHAELIGRLVRLLFDAERLDDVAVRLERALSRAADAVAKAAWIDGFFADGALLLIHDPVLRGLLDDWVRGLDEREFVDMLPLVRRTFGTFSTAERRAIAERIAAAEAPATVPVAEQVDAELAAPALATVDLILGR
jgi:Family of unknown function (DUF5682)